MTETFTKGALKVFLVTVEAPAVCVSNEDALGESDSSCSHCWKVCLHFFFNVTYNWRQSDRHQSVQHLHEDTEGNGELKVAESSTSAFQMYQ